MPAYKINPAEYGPYSLAVMAGCGTPDSHTSHGALFLNSVLQSTADILDWEGDDYNPEDDNYDMVAGIADGAPDVYTHTMWGEFFDLCAYNEDPTDLGFDGVDMEQGARLCLYAIAERLAAALLDEAVQVDGDKT